MDASDVERVRLPAELAFAQAIGLVRRRTRVPLTAAQASDARLDFRARGVPLTREIAPGLQLPLDVVRQRLGVSDPVDVYQVAPRHAEYWSALHVGRRAGAVVVGLLGSVLDALDDAALRTVLGHELGHHLAHSEEEWDWSGTPFGHGHLFTRLYLGRELTADRFGLLAEPELAASIRAEMSLASGLRSTSTALDAEAYRRWCTQSVEESLAVGAAFQGETHPEHAVRVYAMTLFHESDLFRELTGAGTGQRRIGDVNRVLERIVLTMGRPPSWPNAMPAEPGPTTSRPALDAPRPVPVPVPDVDTEPHVVPATPTLDDLSRLATTTASRVQEAAVGVAAWWVGRERPKYSRPIDDDADVAPEITPIDPAKAALLARFAELEKKLAKKDTG